MRDAAVAGNTPCTGQINLLSTAVRCVIDEIPPPARADCYPHWRQPSRRRRHGGGHNCERLGNIIEPLDAVPQGRGSGFAVAFATHAATQLRHGANGFIECRGSFRGVRIFCVAEFSGIRFFPPMRNEGGKNSRVGIIA